jgi:acylphosphatase
MATQSNKCRRCLVSGGVQGVFFRASARDKAQELGLTGYARNLSGGQVEVYACGTEAQLKALEEWLWEGSTAANVTAVECKAAEHQQFDGFETR